MPRLANITIRCPSGYRTSCSKTNIGINRSPSLKASAAVCCRHQKYSCPPPFSLSQQPAPVERGGIDHVAIGIVEGSLACARKRILGVTMKIAPQNAKLTLPRMHSVAPHERYLVVLLFDPRGRARSSLRQ